MRFSFLSETCGTVIFPMVSSAQVTWLHPRGVIGRVNALPHPALSQREKEKAGD
jgi:hypothetical protein